MSVLHELSSSIVKRVVKSHYEIRKKSEYIRMLLITMFIKASYVN